MKKIFKDFQDLTPEQVVEKIKKEFDMIDKQDAGRTMTRVPHIMKAFFKAQGIFLQTAIENGLLMYMYLILYREQNPKKFDTYDAFMVKFYKQSVENRRSFYERNYRSCIDSGNNHNNSSDQTDNEKESGK
jgi:hypothetical protein